MNTLDLIQALAAAAVGAGLAAFAVHRHMRRTLEQASERLHRSEAARHAAVERSNQARAQITQLAKELEEERRRQASITYRRQRLEQQLDAALAPTEVLPPNERCEAFADTLPLTHA